MIHQSGWAIETKNLTKSYGDIHALSGLNLAVPSGSIVGFLGPNGAGKSTTIKLLLGLIRPTSGSGRIFDLDMVRQSTDIRRRVGYLAQHPSFYPNLTARETLRFVARFFYRDANHIERQVEEALELVDLADKADRMVKGFSGGELQRLGIAQAQVNQPELLILDEPAAALDPMGREQVLIIMQQLRKRSTVFFSTHILDDVQRVSDHVVILNRGQLVAQGPIGDLLNASSDPVYRIVLHGQNGSAYERVAAQPWVSDIAIQSENSATTWRVQVTDEVRARHELLRLILADPSTDILSFDRLAYELEDVFMQLIGGES